MRHVAPACTRAFRRAMRILPVLIAAAFVAPIAARAQCTEQGPFQYYTGTTQVACPCFVAGERAGVVFQLPASVYPIEITRVGIAWGSIYGGSGQSAEEALLVYAGGLPNPGSPIFTLTGPVLTDGAFNEFNLDALPGEVRVESGPFTVALEFYNDNAGNYFAGSVVDDGNGCQAGRNVVYTGGTWYDACSLGVSGDWLFYIKYRSLKVTAQGSPSQVVFSNAPANQTTCSTVTFTNTGCDTLTIKGIYGCGAAPFSIDSTATSHMLPPGQNTTLQVCVTPTTANPANCAITMVSNASNGSITIPVSLGSVTAVTAAPVSPEFAILGIVPNPFNPETSVRFHLPREATVTVEVFDVNGTRVRTLESGRSYPAGENEVRWDGRNAGGATVASGVYLVRVSTPLGTRVARAVLLE